VSAAAGVPGKRARTPARRGRGPSGPGAFTAWLVVPLLATAMLGSSAPRPRALLPADLPLSATAPDSFLAEFRTTKGSFVMKARRAWSPLGVDRLYQLVNGGYFDGLTIYRVGETKSVKGGRVVQFGQSGDTAASHAWERATFADEPVRRAHVRGSVNFARGGPNTRSVEIAICTTAIAALDTVQYLGVTGFPTIAEVVEGLGVLDKLNEQYGNAPIENDSLSILGGEYLERVFPGLDRIESASVTKTWGKRPAR
jgi:peptidyl-prolyl cis-trans isomerase A (cyclophilin A)